MQGPETQIKSAENVNGGCILNGFHWAKSYSVPHLLSWLPSASIWLWRPRKTEYPSLNSRALYFWILFLKTLPGNSKPHDEFIRTVNTAIKTDIHRMRSRSSCKGGRVCTWSWPVCLKHDRIIHCDNGCFSCVAKLQSEDCYQLPYNTLAKLVK